MVAEFEDPYDAVPPGVQKEPLPPQLAENITALPLAEQTPRATELEHYRQFCSLLSARERAVFNAMGAGTLDTLIPSNTILSNLLKNKVPTDKYELGQDIVKIRYLTISGGKFRVQSESGEKYARYCLLIAQDALPEKPPQPDPNQPSEDRAALKNEFDVAWVAAFESAADGKLTKAQILAILQIGKSLGTYNWDHLFYTRLKAENPANKYLASRGMQVVKVSERRGDAAQFQLAQIAADPSQPRPETEIIIIFGRPYQVFNVTEEMKSLDITPRETRNRRGKENSLRNAVLPGKPTATVTTPAIITHEPQPPNGNYPMPAATNPPDDFSFKHVNGQAATDSDFGEDEWVGTRVGSKKPVEPEKAPQWMTREQAQTLVGIIEKAANLITSRFSLHSRYLGNRNEIKIAWQRVELGQDLIETLSSFDDKIEALVAKLTDTQKASMARKIRESALDYAKSLADATTSLGDRQHAIARGYRLMRKRFGDDEGIRQGVRNYFNDQHHNEHRSRNPSHGKFQF